MGEKFLKKKKSRHQRGVLESFFNMSWCHLETGNAYSLLGLTRRRTSRPFITSSANWHSEV